MFEMFLKKKAYCWVERFDNNAIKPVATATWKCEGCKMAFFIVAIIFFIHYTTYKLPFEYLTTYTIGIVIFARSEILLKMHWIALKPHAHIQTHIHCAALILDQFDFSIVRFLMSNQRFNEINLIFRNRI